MAVKKAEGKKFSITVDATRAKMLKELSAKFGIRQNGIINTAISKLHELEFPDKK